MLHNILTVKEFF